MSSESPTPSAGSLQPTIDRRRVAWSLGAIFLLALVLRLWGITFGLPYLYQVSENMYVVSAQAADTDGQLDSLFGFYQAVLWVEFQLVELLRPLFDSLPLSAAMEATLADHGAAFHLLGRLTSAFVGAATVFPMFALGRRLWNARVGLLAALLLAVVFMHVRSSHYAKPEIVACFFMVTAAWLGTRLVARHWPSYLLAGLAGGLAVSSKQLAWPIMIALFMLHWRAVAEAAGAAGVVGWLRSLGRAVIDPRWWACGLASIAVFLAFSPQAITEFESYYAFWLWVGTIGEGGGMERFDLHEGRAAWQVYLRAFGWGVGGVLSAIGVLGLLDLLRRRRPVAMVLLLIFPVLLFAFLLRPQHAAHERYILLSIPFLLLAASAVVVQLSARLPGPAARWALLGVATLLMMAEPTLYSVQHNMLLAREDTRTQAKRWIEENIPQNSAIALEAFFYSPQLLSKQWNAPLSDRFYRVTNSGPYGLSEASKTSGTQRNRVQVMGYIMQGFDYVVTDGHTAQIPRLDDYEQETVDYFYADLEKRGTLVKEFSPLKEGREAPPYYFTKVYGPAIDLWDYERNGPIIRIYELPKIR
ncbi:MAG: glycosyltransferase family 39 protein [Acidobacteriota bacterium]